MRNEISDNDRELTNDSKWLRFIHGVKYQLQVIQVASLAIY